MIQQVFVIPSKRPSFSTPPSLILALSSLSLSRSIYLFLSPLSLSLGTAAARFTHDVIALAAFGVDVDSVRATVERPCKSFDAMATKTSAIDKLITKPLDM